MNVHLHHNSGFSWYQDGSCHVKGYLFDEHGRYYAGEELLAYFGSATTVEERDDKAQRANGCFCCVIRLDGSVVALTDRVRSIPLFYSTAGAEPTISDDANWIRQQLGDPSLDEEAVEEFRLTGYVTGSGTLFRGINQIRAGERVSLEQRNSAPKLTTYRYYTFDDKERFETSRAEMYAALEAILYRVFERLLESTRGRTLVLPLSSGVDSTSIAAMLKELGRADVLCFSYGKPGNRESEQSRQTARKLGFPWTFVPYSNESWSQWIQTKERREYATYAEQLTSTPHIQDWPAVWRLKQEGRIPDDAVFVPGHTTVGVSQGLPVRRGERAVVANIEEKHYSLTDWSKDYRKLAPIFENRIREVLSEAAMSTWEEAARATECWDWQEGKAKFIVNAVRAYEFWGYEWRLPLWDEELMTFWARVPFRLRIGKLLFVDYCYKKLARPANLLSFSQYLKYRRRPLFWKAYRKLPLLIKLKNIYEAFKKSRRRRRAWEVYHRHPLASYGRVQWEQFKKVYTGVEPPQYFRILNRLQKLMSECSDDISVSRRKE